MPSGCLAALATYSANETTRPPALGQPKPLGIFPTALPLVVLAVVPLLDGRLGGTSITMFLVFDGAVPRRTAGSAMLPKVTTSPILCSNLERIGTDVFGISLLWEWQLRATNC